MKKFEYETYLNETKIAAYKVKAIADAFAHEYIDSNDYHLIAMRIETNSDSYVYLYTALHDALCEVCARLDKLEDVKIEGVA